MRKLLSIALAASLIPATPISGAFAAPIAPAPVSTANDASTPLLQVKDNRHGGGKHVNRNAHVNRNVNRNVKVNRNVNVNRNVKVNRNVNVHRNVNVNRNVNRKAYHGWGRNYHYSWRYNGGRWVRPSDYWWIAGGAIAAGAAIGYLTSVQAAAWASNPPGPGYCWYYTDPARTSGFWDTCP